MPSKYQVSPRSILRSRGALSSSNPFSIISFGVVSMVITLLGVITASLAVALVLGAINSPSAFATEPSPTTASASSDVTLNLSSAVSIRVLDSTATTDISKLSFDFTPTAAGVSSTSRAVVEVGTSNETGYKLYMQSDYQDSNSNYTTSLVNADSDIPSSIGTIPTVVSGAGTTVKNYWNYYNPLISPTTGSAIGTSLIPAYGSPDKIAQGFTTTAADYTNVDITVGIDSTIAAGTYNNQLLFTAIANASPINYSLYYEQNLPAGADVSTLANFPSDQTASSIATSYNFTIPATTPTLEGYTLTNYLDLDTASEPTPTTYSPGDTITVLADTSSSTSNNDGEKTLRANWAINNYTLTVNPNGGTWNGSTSAQTFTQDYNTTKSIANPSANATYTISYNDNSQGASYTPSPASVARAFSSWSLTDTSSGGAGNGTWNSSNHLYTYGAGNDTLTANYNTTSNSFTLPAISKTGYTCKWAEGSSSGTQYEGGTTRTITADQTYYAVCTVNSHTVTANKGTGIATTTVNSTASSASANYGSTVTLGYTMSAGYHFTGWTTTSGGVTVNNNQFTMPDNDVVVQANGALNTCTIAYNNNGGSGTMNTSSLTYGSNTTTRSNTFTRTGYQFSGWRINNASTGTTLANGGSLSGTTYCKTNNSTVTLYAQWTKKYTYTLNLYTNDGTTSKQTLNYPTSGGTTNTSHTFTNLNNQAPTREGYNFLGWATTSTGTSYVTSRTLNSSSASSTPTTNGFPVTDSLYAIWEKIPVNFWTITTMQEMTAEVCNSVYTPNNGTGDNITLVDNAYDYQTTYHVTADGTRYVPQRTLYDIRGADGTGTSSNPVTSGSNAKTYTIRKLADGNCWMSENLQLPLAEGVSVEASYNDGTTFMWSPTGCIDKGACAINGQTATYSTYGWYYNWYAATAEVATTLVDGADYDGSICPKGWRMPSYIATDSYSYTNLANSYGITQSGGYSAATQGLFDTPVSLVKAGTYGGGYAGNRFYSWASTYRSNSLAYVFLVLDNGYTYFNNWWEYLYSGLSVRCVASPLAH